MTKKFKELHIIVIDDLERINDNTNIEELFGIIDEIKRCNNVKVILIANTKELKEKEAFEKYSEKVIDRTYEITEHTSNIDWKRLNIDSDFINEFLKMHRVQNLRTLQKAQKLYEDVKMYLKGDYVDEFYDEIRLVCYAIVIETVDELYNGENDDIKNDTVSKMVSHLSNRLDVRIKSNYLCGVCISGNMLDIIHKYYENEKMIDISEIDGEYQIFLHAGDKANFYKSDEEIREVLTKMENDIRTENMLGKLIKYADEYFIWSEKLELDIGQIREEYKQKLHDMVYPEIINGKLEFLTYGLDSNMQSEINQKIAQDVILKIRIELIERYMQYLSENMQDELAYEYSYNLRKFVNNVNYRNIIFENIDKLYNKKSFPINDVTEIQYRTSYNIMYVLYVENEKRFLDYCNKIKTECDHMAAHRINTVIEQISEKSSNGLF